MSRWGVGPVFAFLSIGYGLITFLISCYYYPFFQIDCIPNELMRLVGIILIFIGVPFFITSVVTVMRAYNSDKLVTSGIFQCCRHPLYASWVVFIVPGIVLVVKSWIGLTTPIFMYLLLRKLVIKEEIYLEKTFGINYLKYKRNTPCILPFGLLKLNL